VNKKIIKTNFEGFWPSFDPCKNSFFNFLIKNEFISMDKYFPDITIYSDDYAGKNNLKSPRILLNVENRNFSDWNFKYTMSFKKPTNNNFFFQNFFYYPYFQDLASDYEGEEYLKLKWKNKNKHINFIYTNPKASVRNQYLKFLNENSINVDSMGLYKNNTPYIEDSNINKQSNKLIKISEYKYTVAFENSYHKNYISEKIWEPLCVNSIPIYYGGESVFKIFNKKKFIYVKNKFDFKKSLEKIREIDDSQDFYNNILHEPIFANDDIKQSFAYKILARKFYQFLEEAVSDKNPKIKFKIIKRFLYLYSKFLRENF
jgi:hypothetical protein